MSLVAVLLETRRPRRGVQEEERENAAGSPHLQTELPVVAPGLLLESRAALVSEMKKRA
jgi:hypothetical protein